MISSASTSTYEYLPVEDFIIETEDGEDIDIVALFEGPNGTPMTWL